MKSPQVQIIQKIVSAGTTTLALSNAFSGAPTSHHQLEGP